MKMLPQEQQNRAMLSFTLTLFFSAFATISAIEYLGDDIYPCVISVNAFRAVQMLKSDKTVNPVCKVSDVIRGKTLCGRCGAKINRTKKGRKTTRWECENHDCGYIAHINDEWLVATVDTLLDELAHTPIVLSRRIQQEAAPTHNATRIANELTNAFNRGSESTEYLRALIFACAAERYNELPDHSLQHKVDMLRSRLESGDESESLHRELLETTVRSIQISDADNILLELVNGQIIGKETAKA